MNNLFLKKADENLPVIIKREIVPELLDKILVQGDEIIIDLGNHYVGYFSFKMGYVDIYIDAPVRLCVRFCETKRELDDDFSSYKGELCKSWLQEELVNIDFPGEVNMPRRYAARYIKITVDASPKKLKLSDFKFTAVTSADTAQLKKYRISDKELEKIDAVSVNTLKNCMHRVFEDGPKRDRRLWIGDLRLEALANYYTFDSLPIVRRCLYLFAAAGGNANEFVPGCLYENPEYVPAEGALLDYSLLFAACVCDYYKHTGDKEVLDDLYPVIKNQMDMANSILDADGIITADESWGAFIDWCKELNKITAFHGVYLYVLGMLTEVLESIGHNDKALYAERYSNAYQSAVNTLYDKEKKLFVNAKDNFQYSVHSAVWMILGGVADGETAEKILLDALNSNESVKPFTPYMHHYVVEAMVKLGMLDEAKTYIKNYWGGMAKQGADTFYEVYVPSDADFSPYGDRMINSMCHAWSCTPSYFVRKYFAE